MILMKLRQPNRQTDIAAAQIISMSKTHVVVKTEQGRILRLSLSPQHQRDQVFRAALKDWHNKIWIPVNTKLRQLFRYDWLTEPVMIDD